ncbi:MAG TPA: TonB-dependent receptor [Xanthomonadales bacterium]|nr:TonB-dependent receptor [Xanthomonadales bacterium]
MYQQSSLATRISILFALATTGSSTFADSQCLPETENNGSISPPYCMKMETVSVFGATGDAESVAGGANYISAQDLEKFEITDVARALRQVPGVSIQVEDGWALRPNISIRGTATERSSRITLLEDNVLIAPAPYAASSAYYFPTFGRINGVEVLKGPSSITQGPYTIGGALNLISTPIPSERSGMLQGEAGSDSTWRVHAWYGDQQERFGYVLETHQWQSDGYQSVDRSSTGTGLDKEDYLAKLAWYSKPGLRISQTLELKLQTSSETSGQSYLGLTDRDFDLDALRRYGVSVFDEMDNDHDQVVVNWRLESDSGLGATVTAYHNDTSRAWYKTEGIDLDGSESPEVYSHTSWASVVSAINQGNTLGGFDANELQAILDGADTQPGSIQVRNNSRDYYSQGVQLTFDWERDSGEINHLFQAGIRYHEDEEDRLQRNDTYQQLNGQLMLSQVGLEGNAGNRIQSADAWALYAYDRIDWGDWTFTPGLRYESIDLERIRYQTSSDNPASRDPENFRDSRSNEVDIWLPGMGVIYRMPGDWSLVGGIHKGFAVPGNQPGVDPEESINYEYGVRFDGDLGSFEAMGFFNDYSNLVGVCTNSSGTDCDVGDSFNGDAVEIPGLELTWRSSIPLDNGWSVPLQLSYTWMNAEFQTDFNSDFFGEVQAGDPVPYVPENQLWVSTGIENGQWAFDVSLNYVDSVCTTARCGEFEGTEPAMMVDLAAHYYLNEKLELYGLVENVADDLYIAGRQPYGARPNKARTFIFGARLSF